jgi:hypothetical protein
MRLVGVIVPVLLAVVALGASGAAGADSELTLRPGPKGTLASTDLFRLQVSLNGQTLPEEWTSPGTGAYSTVIQGTKYWFDRGDALIYRRPDDGGARALYHGDHEYLRAFSSRDIDFRTGAALVLVYVSGAGDKVQGDPKPSFKASTEHGRTVIELHASYPHDNGASDPLDYRVTVVERISLSEARKRGLLHGKVKPTSTTWQSRPGAPSHTGLEPYWLGARVGRDVAVMVEERGESADDPASYLTWYAAPSSVCAMRDGTAGKNHWWPGLGGNNCDEWEITTTAAGSNAHMSGPRTSRKIKLADGTPAHLLTAELSVAFWVQTRTALVEIMTGDTEEPAAQLAIARSLRPSADVDLVTALVDQVDAVEPRVGREDVEAGFPAQLSPFAGVPPLQRHRDDAAR